MKVKKIVIAFFSLSALIFLLIGLVLVFRFGQMDSAISAYNNQEYEDAALKFEVPQPVIAFESWKAYYNKGTAFIRLEKLAEARDSFQLSYALSGGNQEAQCLIANNWAYAYEKSAAAYVTQQAETKSDAMSRSIIGFLTQATKLRGEQVELCRNKETEFILNVELHTKTDVELLDSYTNVKPPEAPKGDTPSQEEANANYLKDLNEGGLSEYLNAKDLIQGSTDYQGKKW